MPKLDSLQSVFGDKIKLLSVTYQPEGLITKFLKTNRYLNNRKTPVHRPTVVDDRILRSYFRYETNPHVVWINKGKVVAITGGEYITSNNIQTLLDGKAVDWPLKTERFDSTTPFISINKLWQDASDSPFYGYSVLTGQATSVPEDGGIHFIQDSVYNRTRIAILNQDIFTTYRNLLFASKPEVKIYENNYGKTWYINTHPNRTILEVKDPGRISYKAAYGEYTDWVRKNALCYEQVKQGIVDKTVMAKLAVQDLDSRLGLDVRYEKRKVKCLVFVKTNNPVVDIRAIELGGAVIMSHLLLNLDLSGKYLPAIDETGFTGGLNFQSTDGTIAGLRKEMQRHNLDLIEAEREIEVMVISDRKDL